MGLQNAVLGGCPTIYLDRIEKRLPEVADADKGCTLISVRHPSLMNISLHRQVRVHDEIAGILKLLRDQGHRDIRLLCHDHRDIPFAASFGDMPYVYIPDPHGYLALLKHCRLNVTYRVHSALPCMALGTPFVKLSYDERAISLMKTVGFGEWNIDIVKSGDVVGEVSERLANLNRIAGIKKTAAPQWARLKHTQDSAMKRFAAAVRAHHHGIQAPAATPLV
jgi:polysaccharide pyruvyl transferase WcaK-like protein